MFHETPKKSVRDDSASTLFSDNILALSPPRKRFAFDKSRVLGPSHSDLCSSHVSAESCIDKLIEQVHSSYDNSVRDLHRETQFILRHLAHVRDSKLESLLRVVHDSTRETYLSSTHTRHYSVFSSDSVGATLNL